LRPSVGLVPTHPTDWVWDTLQVTGPMARTAEDVALMLQTIAGPAEHSPFAQPTEGRDFVRGAKGARKNLRLAYCGDIAGIGVDPDVERVCREAAFALAGKGAVVEEIQLDLSEGRPAFLSLRGLWFVTQMFSRLDMQDRFGPNVGNNVRSGLEVTSKEIAAAEAYRGRLWHQFRQFFNDYDHLLTPCVAVPPFPVEQNYPDTIAGKPMKTYIDWIAPTFVLSLTGLPSASVPAGLDSSGMPVGLQIAGGQFGEEDVLSIAAQIQKLRPLGLPRL
jgi:amidase